MRNRLTYVFVTTAFLLFFSHGVAKADCYTQCDADYASCNHNCPQCPCYEIYQACFDGCQYADTDNDGVTDSNDNCTETYNPNQADCEPDGIGDACDPQIGFWDWVSTGTSKCELNTKTVWNGHRLSIYYRGTYQNSCTGALCYRGERVAQFVCGWGVDEFQCCKDKWNPDSDCGGVWNVYECGQPRCSF